MGRVIPADWFLAVLLLPASMLAAFAQFEVLGLQPSPATLGETVGFALGLVLIPAAVVSTWRLVQRRKRRRSNAPIVVASLLFLVQAVLTIVGLSIEARATSPSRIAYEKHVDRNNGFSITYDPSLRPIEANEAATKFLATSHSGRRCWVVIVANPLIASAADAQAVHRYVLEQPDLLREEYAKLFGAIAAFTVSPTIVSGNHEVALIRYQATYRQLDFEIPMTVVEAHIFRIGRTTKVGCSSGLSDDGGFDSIVTTFLRGFVLLPPAH